MKPVAIRNMLVALVSLGRAVGAVRAAYVAVDQAVMQHARTMELLDAAGISLEGDEEYHAIRLAEVMQEAREKLTSAHDYTVLLEKGLIAENMVPLLTQEKGAAAKDAVPGEEGENAEVARLLAAAQEALEEGGPAEAAA